MEDFELAISNQYSTPDMALEALELEEEKDENGLTGSDRARIIKEAQKRAKECHAYWDDRYDEMETDWDYYDATDDKQWSQEAKDKRKGRSVLTVNQIPKFVDRLLAESHKNPPAIKIAARESGDRFKAEIGSGIVRFIEDASGAKYSYNHALKCTAIGGLGWLKLTFNDKGMIEIKKVADPFTWYMDPEAEEANGRDARYFISHNRKKEGKKLVDTYEYWWKDDNEVFWAIIEGNEVLEYGEWPTQYLPIYPMIGMDIRYKGNRTVKGIVRNLRDPQDIYNWTRSQEVDMAAFTPKPVVAVESGQIDENQERGWRRAGINVVEFGMKNDDNKQASSAPNLSLVQAPNLSWTPQLTSGAKEDMREVSGIYDTALGAESKEISGKAILAKQQTGDASQYIFTEHAQETLQALGRGVIALIKPVMGDQRVVRILGEDGKQSVVELGQPIVDPQTGKQIMLDLDFGEMDITVSAAPAYATRREAGAQAIQDIIAAVPEWAPILGDIALRNLDVPGAEEAARRVKLMLPPQLQDQAEGAVPPEQMLMQAQQAQQAAQAQIDQLNAQVQQLAQQNQSLQFELQSQNQIKMAVEIQKSNTQIMLKRMDIAASNQELQSQLMQEMELQNQKLMADLRKSEMENQSKVAVAAISKPEPAPAPAPAPVELTPVKAVGVFPGNSVSGIPGQF